MAVMTPSLMFLILSHFSSCCKHAWSSCRKRSAEDEWGPGALKALVTFHIEPCTSFHHVSR